MVHTDCLGFFQNMSFFCWRGRRRTTTVREVEEEERKKKNHSRAEGGGRRTARGRRKTTTTKKKKNRNKEETRTTRRMKEITRRMKKTMTCVKENKETEGEWRRPPRGRRSARRRKKHCGVMTVARRSATRRNYCSPIYINRMKDILFLSPRVLGVQSNTLGGFIEVVVEMTWDQYVKDRILYNFHEDIKS